MVGFGSMFDLPGQGYSVQQMQIKSLRTLAYIFVGGVQPYPSQCSAKTGGLRPVKVL